ncbi:MAG TPA: hypothetical protein VIL86_19770 [Tepidisphaeraceae bacterium]|jgi:hypothetical protein
MGCFYWLLLLSGGIFVMVTMLRWFEQATEAVAMRWWNKVFVLLVMPFTVWFFPSKVSAGRPTPAPRHEPVRGFGSIGKSAPPAGAASPAAPAVNADPVAPAPRADQPPPGTPKEFLGMLVTPARRRAPTPVDPEKLAKLKQKMREQGMLGEDEK